MGELDVSVVLPCYNERPVKLRKNCESATPYFYEVAELKRCLR